MGRTVSDTAMHAPAQCTYCFGTVILRMDLQALAPLAVCHKSAASAYATSGCLPAVVASHDSFAKTLLPAH
eukprot:10509871-Alexandrium_andersonii.AAC.1